MATFKTCVRKPRADGYYSVFIRCTHKRKTDYIPTGKMIDKKGLTKTNDVKDVYALSYCATKITGYIEKLNKIDIENWEVKEVTAYLEKENEDICFSEYARKYKREMETTRNMARNARNYELAYQHLERFAGTNQLMFSRFTTKFVSDWIKSLAETARAKEMYPVCIRQIFKEAINEYNDYDRDIIQIKTNPWLKIKIPSSDIPEKRAIAHEKVKEFFTLPLPPTKMIFSLPEFARDVAMMVMCLAGMNTVDIYNLKKENYKNGVICYNRRKTMKFRRDKAYLEVGVPSILMPVFEKYLSDENDEFLFDFHKRYRTDDSFNANVNIGIKGICNHYNMERYCVYTFRHTWGTVARNDIKASMYDVAFAMNHSSAHKVTEAYVKPDYSLVTELNQKVVDFIFEGKASVNNCDLDDDPQKEVEFTRFSFRQLIKGTAYFQGKLVYSFTDTGYNNIDEVISELARHLPGDIPVGCMVQFRVDNLDKGEYKTYDRQKGKGF